MRRRYRTRSYSTGNRRYTRAIADDRMPMSPPEVNKRDWLPLALGCLGILLHLAVGIFYLAAGLVAPLYGILIFWAIWVTLLAVGLWLLRRHPLWALLVPVAALIIFFGGITLGELLLGWSA